MTPHFVCVTFIHLGLQNIDEYWNELRFYSNTKNWPNKLKERNKLYKKLSLKHHPDTSKGNQERFEILLLQRKKANKYYKK